MVTGDLASSESQARPNAAEPASIDLTNEDYDKEQDKEEDKEEEHEEEKEKEQEEKKEKEQEEEEGREKENDQDKEGKEEEMVTIEVEVADSPDVADDGNPEEYQDCEEYRTDTVIHSPHQDLPRREPLVGQCPHQDLPRREPLVIRTRQTSFAWRGGAMILGEGGSTGRTGRLRRRVSLMSGRVRRRRM